MIIAHKVKVGDVILLSNNRIFVVDDRDEFYKNEKIAKLYSEHSIVPAQHTKLTFYNATEDIIENIPGEAPVQILKIIENKSFSWTD